MNNTVVDEIQLDVSQVKVYATSDGLTVSSGWHVYIPKADAVRYIKEYDTKNNNVDAGGFFTDEFGPGFALLSHGPARLKITLPESIELRDFIRTVYL